MNSPGTWPAWQSHPGALDPALGGMSQLAAYDAGLTDNPGCWIQPIDTRDPRLDPQSPGYDPQYAAAIAWEEPSPAEQLAMDQARQAEPEPEPYVYDPELEPPF